jgi:glycosyltransferase involved in cell wall biosynthesis
MNILMVHPHDIYSPVEPWTVRVTYLANEFVKMGHNVRLVYHLENPHKDPELEKNRQEYPFTTIPMVRHSSTLLMKTKRLMKEAKWADVIHFQKAFPYVAIPCVLAGIWSGKPVHYDWDDWEAEIFKDSCPNDNYWYKYINWTEKTLPHIVDTISVASKSIWEKTIHMGIDPTEVFMAPVGGDLDRFHMDQVDENLVKSQYKLRDNVVTYLGQLNGSQYASLFLKMARHLLDERDDITFFVVGNGYKFLDLMREAEELGLKEHVIFTGSVPHEMVPNFLKASDVCVAAFEDTPQTRTKSPLKICEYLAAGRAIVASEMGEVSEMLDHGNCGVLVRPGDARALAGGVQKVLEDPDLKAHLQYNARKQAETRYNWTNTARNILNGFHLGIGEKKKLLGVSNF